MMLVEEEFTSLASLLCERSMYADEFKGIANPD
jgi:hypothetical protein